MKPSVFLLSSGGQEILHLILLLIVFVLIIAGSYYVTYFFAKTKKGTWRHKNFEVIEIFSLQNGKHLELIRVGNKYMVIGVSKNNIEYITSLNKEEIIFDEGADNLKFIPFNEVLSRLKKGNKLKDIDMDRDHGEDQHETKNN